MNGQLAAVIEQYKSAFLSKYAERLSPVHLRALRAIQICRTPEAGEFLLQCPDCHQRGRRPRSCGHRSCPQCQNHAASEWLDRQRKKQLPVSYFMITFTLPFELRALAWQHQSTIYRILIHTVIGTLKDFGRNDRKLGAELGLTAVLHTHSRRLDYHPHLHVIVPGGGVDAARRQWRKTKGAYLFNAFALAKVFRARFLDALKAAKLPIPPGMPAKWVVDCKPVGNGEPALKYLSRYLYRGVIREQDIVAHPDGTVSFRYVESATGQTRTRTLPGEDFLWKVLQHVLPKGFRRVRDFGFLHGNARKLLNLVQLILNVTVDAGEPRHRPAFLCPHCRKTMRLLALTRPVWQSG